jgi:hypothetical protein
MPTGSPPTWLDRLLRHPRALLAALFLAVLLPLPWITLGFFTDDYIHAAMLEGRAPAGSSWLDLYRFTTGDPEFMRDSIARGWLPWWTQLDHKVHFLRPLSSALIALDHRIFGDDPLGYHLHSIAWYLGLVVAAGLLLRRAIPGATGGLALVLFAVDEAHGAPVGWIACRHLLVAAVPSVLGLYAHLRYREDGWRPGRYLSFAGLALGFLGGEAALGAVAYWIAYEIAGPCGSRAPGWRPRLLDTLPVLGFSAIYFVAYKAFGFGAFGNEVYVEPLSDPRGFALALARRLPILVGDLFAGVPSDLSHSLPKAPFIAAGVVAIGGIGLLYRAALPAIPEAERRAVRWLVPGALLALVATLGGIPGSRLLLLPSLGGAVLLATILRYGLRRVAGARLGAAGLALRRFGWGAVALVHAVLAPILFAANALVLAPIARSIEEIARTAEIDGPRPSRVFVVAGSDPMAALFPGFVRLVEEPRSMVSWQVLSMAKYSHRLARNGASSFQLAPIEGRMLEGPFEKLYRTSRAPFRAGDVVAIDGAKVTVIAVDQGAPTLIEVRFDVPLEHASLCLLAWQGGRLRRIVLPRVGESVELVWEPGPTGMF